MFEKFQIDSFHLKVLQFIFCFVLSLFFLPFFFSLLTGDGGITYCIFWDYLKIENCKMLNGEFSFNIKAKLLFCSLSSASSSVSPKDLGDACQNIWNAAAGSNLRVPSELTVDLAGKNPLFTVEGNGVPKINSLEFIRFRGN